MNKKILLIIGIILVAVLELFYPFLFNNFLNIAFERLDAAKVVYQMAELGKVDQGGGGTIAYYLANQGLDVIDCGVAVLSMHAPFEITSKADIYEAYRGYKAFLKEA